MLTIDLSRLHAAASATWHAVGRLTTTTSPTTWALVGGQMVLVHATAAGVAVPRATDDGDIVVDVRSHTRQAIEYVAAALIADGFAADQSADRVVRFSHDDGAKIDLLSPEGLGTKAVETGQGRAVQAPGATQALKRACWVSVRLADEEFQIRTPSLLGALVAKAAAATEIPSATTAGKEKHERDLATLLTCAAHSPELLDMPALLTKKDRTRISKAAVAFENDLHACWSDGASRSDIGAVLGLLLE